MEHLIDILKISIPALVVSATVVIIISRYFRNERDAKDQELQLKNKEVSLPLKFQAFERLVLLMERVSLNNILLRLSSAEMTVDEFKFELMHTITQEFEHNLAQQLYVSNAVWQQVKNAKDHTLAVINNCANSLDRNGPANELVNLLIAHTTNDPTPPTFEAIYALKKEAETLG